MHEQRVERVAHRRALHLGVADHRQRAGEVGVFIDVQMADADTAGDHGNAALAAAEGVQTGTSARDDQIDQVVELQQFQ